MSNRLEHVRLLGASVLLYAAVCMIFGAPILEERHEWLLAFLGYGTLIGTWASSALLILDWDRPWQAWPYPCVMGSIFGAIVGLLIHSAHSLYRRSAIPPQLEVRAAWKTQSATCKLRMD